MTDDELELFKVRLAETITWCNIKADIADPKFSLRSSLLRPHDVTYDEHGNVEYGEFCNYDWTKAVDHVSSIRSSEIDKQNISLVQLVDNIHGGLLGLSDYFTMLECLSEIESLGFYDSNDLLHGIPGFLSTIIQIRTMQEVSFWFFGFHKFLLI
jgi:hypothetical protein